MEHEVKQRRLEKDQPHITKMKEVLKHQLVDEVTVKDTMNLQWGLIISSGILDNLVPDKSEQEVIKLFLTKHYMQLSEMYKYYSAVNSSGGTHTLEYIEFSKFLCEADIFEAGQHSTIILKIFLESHMGDEKKTSSASIHSEIHQYEFFVSLIKIAIYKYITLAKKETVMLKKKGHQVSISTAMTPTQSNALQMLFDEYLKSVIQKISSGVVIKEALGSDDVLVLLYKNIDTLTKIFCEYAECKDRESVVNGIMNLKQFGSFATDAQFVGKCVYSNVDVALKDVRQIFSASQYDSTAIEDGDDKLIRNLKTGRESESDQEEMVFSEFLEAIARLGVIKWSHKYESASYLNCISRALENCHMLSKTLK